MKLYHHKTSGGAEISGKRVMAYDELLVSTMSYFQLLLKDLEEIKSVIYEDTERAEELLDHIIREVTINAAQQPLALDGAESAQRLVFDNGMGASWKLPRQ